MPVISNVDVTQLAAAIEKLPDVEWPGGWPNDLGLCLLDAVYSVNADYVSTILPMINRYQKTLPEAQIFGISELRQAIDIADGPEGFAALLGNRQRTSTRNGILKADAVHQLAAILSSDQYRVETAADLQSLDESGELAGLKSSWCGVRGQRSGITWRYFLMLAGIDGVKPDRMIVRFVESTLDRKVRPDEAAQLVTDAAASIGTTATFADHRIWSFQRPTRRGRTA